MTKVHISNVTIHWFCDECRHNRDTVTDQRLADYILDGSPLCTTCLKAMDLMDEVTARPGNIDPTEPKDELLFL